VVPDVILVFGGIVLFFFLNLHFCGFQDILKELTNKFS
jgi:hypothetical protein